MEQMILIIAHIEQPGPGPASMDPWQADFLTDLLGFCGKVTYLVYEENAASVVYMDFTKAFDSATAFSWGNCSWLRCSLLSKKTVWVAESKKVVNGVKYG